MPDIDEVEVISTGGVPFYYHSNTGREQDEAYLLQASFITALTQFADELDNGEVKLISMERKHYLLTKSQQFTVIFTSYHEDGPDKLIEYEPTIASVKQFLDQQLGQSNIDLNDPSNRRLDNQLSEFDSYLRDQQLVIREDDNYDSARFRNNVNRLIFRSVGYEPGVCNIGEAERFRRLTFGLFFFLISMMGFALIIGLQLPTWTVFLLTIPNFLGFLGLLQYFYRFCTTNALSQQYQMR